MTTTPAGWYDDGSGSLRWWDGVQWTAHVRAATATPTAPDSAPEAARAEEAAVTPAVPTPEEPVAPAVPTPEAFAAPYTLPSTQTPGAPSAGVAPSGVGNPAYGGFPGAAPSAPPSKPKSRISVLGLIGLVAVVLGVVLACIPIVAIAGWGLLALGFVLALVSVFLRGAKWPGITGMAVGVVGAIVAAAISLISLGAQTWASPDESEDRPRPVATDSPSPSPDAETTTEGDLVDWWEVKVGDCLPTDQPGADVAQVRVVSCDLPHADEVYFEFDLADGEYPGDDAVLDEATSRCEEAFADFIGIAYADSELDFYPVTPTQYTWNKVDDRVVQCSVYDNRGDVTGSLAGAAR
ncbi:DUF2510 domain-containing protein [Microbacterium sp. A8/3-1]|uniref:DUF2510 domain-containing protein n=1 Tax=Microbacterium sp. A8/3-1 TaxID=3160749 RepID=A0AAU7VYA0_9MICO